MNKSDYMLTLIKISILVVLVSIFGRATNLVKAQSDQTRYDGQPALSPDGTKIAFISDRDGNNDLWLMQSNGANPVNLTSFTDLDAFSPQWSPDSQKVLFLAGKDQTSIYLASILDKTVENLTPNLTFGAGRPLWSPDGKLIAFVEIENAENSTLWVMDADGTNCKQLLSGNHNDFPKWSSDGKSIAYTITNGGQIQLALAEIETGKTRILSTNSVLEFAWAPHSNLIVYTTQNSNDLFHVDLWLVQTDTASNLKLTDKPVPLMIEPVWSPDEKSILYRSICQSNGAIIGDIIMFDLQQKLIINITGCQQGNNAFVNWFSDSKHILLQSDRSGKMSIWVMSADGKDAVDLVNPSQ